MRRQGRWRWIGVRSDVLNALIVCGVVGRFLLFLFFVL